MKINEPFIHLFKTPGGNYIYDVNKNVIIRTSQETWDLIRDGHYDPCDFYDRQELLAKMKAEGFLSSKRLIEIIHPADEVLINYLERKVRMITLQVTQQCNLRCDYCVYSGGYENRIHGYKKMNYDIAKKSIDFYLEHSIDSEVFVVGFYGGEPLIEFELIKKCVSYIESVSEGKELLLSMTTNGTLLNEEIVSFLEEHNFSLLISLDGPREVHDKNRKFAFNSCGTFDIVMENVNMIKSKFPKYYKKITFNAVMDQTNDFSCINKFFTNYETIKNVNLTVSKINNNYAKYEITETEDFHCKMGYEYFKLLLSKAVLIDDKYVSKIVLKDYEYLQRVYKQLQPTEELPKKGHHGGPCIPGVQRLFVNVEGDIFPCERVSEFSDSMNIGNISRGFNLDKIRHILNIGKLSEDSCKNCWAFRFCILCAASADTSLQLSRDMKLSKCNNVRNMVENNLKDLCTLKEYGVELNTDNWFILM